MYPAIILNCWVELPDCQRQSHAGAYVVIGMSVGLTLGKRLFEFGRSCSNLDTGGLWLYCMRAHWLAWNPNQDQFETRDYDMMMMIMILWITFDSIRISTDEFNVIWSLFSSWSLFRNPIVSPQCWALASWLWTTILQWCVVYSLLRDSHPLCHDFEPLFYSDVWCILSWEILSRCVMTLNHYPTVICGVFSTERFSPVKSIWPRLVRVGAQVSQVSQVTPSCHSRRCQVPDRRKKIDVLHCNLQGHYWINQCNTKGYNVSNKFTLKFVKMITQLVYSLNAWQCSSDQSKT